MYNQAKRNRIAVLASILAVLVIAGCGNSDRSAKGENTMTEVSEMNEPVTDSMKRVGTEDIAPALLAGEYDRLYAQFSKPLKEIVSLEDFRSMGQDFTADIDSFRLTSTLRLNGYETMVWDDQTGSKGLTATLDATGTIQGIRILPYTAYPESDNAYSDTIFEYPFEGEWLVFWGGHNALVNYHYEYEHVRYAYDWVKEQNGYTYEGDPRRNESYFAFDQDILAPADGVVVAAVDGIADNEPVGEVNEDQPAGNMVTIQHPNGEFSTIGHLKNGSVKVSVGDQVAAGQLIGKCGNSGNSTEPHIHFQAFVQSDAANGNTIPATFHDNNRPIRGDTIVGKTH